MCRARDLRTSSLPIGRSTLSNGRRAFRTNACALFPRCDVRIARLYLRARNNLGPNFPCEPTSRRLRIMRNVLINFTNLKIEHS